MVTANLLDIAMDAWGQLGAASPDVPFGSYSRRGFIPQIAIVSLERSPSYHGGIV